MVQLSRRLYSLLPCSRSASLLSVLGTIRTPEQWDTLGHALLWLYHQLSVMDAEELFHDIKRRGYRNAGNIVVNLMLQINLHSCPVKRMVGCMSSTRDTHRHNLPGSKTPLGATVISKQTAANSEADREEEPRSCTPWPATSPHQVAVSL